VGRCRGCQAHAATRRPLARVAAVRRDDRADRVHDSVAAARLSRRGIARHRCRSAAESSQECDGGVVPRTRMSELGPTLKALYANLTKVILGKQETIFCLLAALIARGHVLLEDVPGTGKTMLARTLAQSLDASMRRLQCTPDLLPSDVTGSSIYRQDHQR